MSSNENVWLISSFADLEFDGSNGRERGYVYSRVAVFIRNAPGGLASSLLIVSATSYSGAGIRDGFVRIFSDSKT